VTARAVILGLAGAVVVSGFTYFNDHVIRQTYFVGCGMPTAVYGALVVFLLAVNPLLARARKRWAFSGGELAVSMALTLCACCIPSAGLMESFPDVVMMPHSFARTEAGWQAENVIGMAPARMLPDVSADPDRALNGYVQGLPGAGGGIASGNVPWSAWTRTLAFWLPLVLAMCAAVVGVSVVVHRQWSDHEKLPYPIATFTDSLLPREGTPHILRSRLFWAGCGAACFVHLVNYAFAWWPQSVVPLPQSVDLTSLNELVPSIVRGGGWSLLRPTLYFTVVGLSFFLPTDLSFSLGVGPYVFYYLAGVLAGFGASMGGGGYEVNLRRSLQAGAYAGMLVLILYTGRRFYASVLRAAVGMKPYDPVAAREVWGARAAITCAVFIAVWLIAVGMDWLLALGFTLLAIGLLVVVGRISAETGYVFIQAYWEPAVLIVGLLGTRAVGPSMALIIFLVSSVLLLDTREALAPYLLNSFKVLDERGVGISRAALLGVGVIAIALAVAVPVTLRTKYDRGTDLSYDWTTKYAPRMAFDETVRIQQRLRTQGVLERAESVSGFGRIVEMAPSPRFLAGFGAALVLFLGLSAARLRFPSWPIHPAMLLVWSTFAGTRFSASVLVGFLVKWIVVKYGGERACRVARPVMIGLIAADMLAGITTSVIGAVYYAVTGIAPPKFVVFIG